jgi:hypothetical protein
MLSFSLVKIIKDLAAILGPKPYTRLAVKVGASSRNPAGRRPNDARKPWSRRSLQT